jgi:ABC-type Zn2+ transport system substrate-binding protein/surface adhesin
LLIYYVEAEAYLNKIINQLIELQQRLFLSDPDTAGILKELNLTNESSEQSKEEGSSKKRKISNEEDDDDNDDEDDEEIYSDTDEEMRANDDYVNRNAAKMSKKFKSFKFKSIQPDQFENYLAKVHNSYKKYRYLCKRF